MTKARAYKRAYKRETQEAHLILSGMLESVRE
jgi:hypothetical protein